MNSKVKKERFRKLSIISLVAGILTYGYIYIIPGFLVPFVLYLRNFIYQENFIAAIVSLSVFILTGLPISAVVCGTVDLKRIKAGLHCNKGRGFDIAGIALGSIYLLIILLFLTGEIFFPH